MTIPNWHHLRTCRACHGIKKEYYGNPNFPNFEIEYWVKYDLYKLKQRNTTIIAKCKKDEFEKILATVL